METHDSLLAFLVGAHVFLWVVLVVLFVVWVLLPFMVYAILWRLRRLETELSEAVVHMGAVAGNTARLASLVAALAEAQKRAETRELLERSAEAPGDRVECPNCSADLGSKYGQPGKHVCPDCGQGFVVE